MLSLQFSKRNILLLGVFTSLVGFVLLTGRAHAATLNVVAGTDTISADGSCRLSEAIENINDQAQTNADCIAGDGNDDTINLPNGTVTLSADLPTITKSIKLQGSGRDKSILNGGSSNHWGLLSNNGTLKVYDLKITAFYEVAIRTEQLSDLDVQRVDFDGSQMTDSGRQDAAISAIQTVMNASNGPARSVNIRDVYIHDVTSNGTGVGAINAINLNVRNNRTLNAILQDITIESIGKQSQGATVQGIAIGTFSNNFEPATFKASLSNITITDISAVNNSAGGIAGLVIVNGGVSNGTIDATNVSISNINGDANPSYGNEKGSLIAAVGTAFGANDTANMTINLKNSIFIDGQEASRKCLEFNGNSLANGNGTVNNNIISQGGNISDDTSCSNYFNKDTDKNNVTTLKDTLNTLADNGGNVPTILPKAGSPVIDGGVCTDAPTADARGVSRPQGKTCDSGAVEVQQASLASEGGLTSVDGKSQIYIDPPVEGAVITSATLAEVGESNDSAYKYPYGMVGFTVAGVPSGSTQTINLYFETDKAAEQFVARKYISAEKKYIDLPDAQITNTTRNNKQVVKVSYQIQDGGELDADGQANGSITDPVGIALESGMLLNTGVPAIIFSLVGAILVLGAALTYFDYRKHKSPLLEADNETHSDYAKQYTFLHHIKTVTIPTARHKFTIRLEKQVKIEA